MWGGKLDETFDEEYYNKSNFSDQELQSPPVRMSTSSAGARSASKSASRDILTAPAMLASSSNGQIQQPHIPSSSETTAVLGLKESERIIDELKKENFNLKLRIFFLEEEFRTNMNGLPSAALEEAERLRQEVRELELENEASVPIDLMAEEIEKAAVGLFEHSLSIPEPLSTLLEKVAALASDRRSLEDNLEETHQTLDATQDLVQSQNEKRRKLRKALKSLATEACDYGDEGEDGDASDEAVIERFMEKSAEMERERSTAALQLKESIQLLEEVKREKEAVLTALKEKDVDLQLNYVKRFSVEQDNQNILCGHEPVIDILRPLHAKFMENRRNLQDMETRLGALTEEASIRRTQSHEALILLEEEAKNTQTRVNELENSLQAAREDLSISIGRENALKLTSDAHESMAQELQEICHQRDAMISEMTSQLESFKTRFSENEDLILQLTSLNKDLQVRLENAEGSTRKQQDWAALHDRSIHQYESELGLYRQQILDFDKLSGIASDEMAYLRCEVESQTKKLRVIEEAWLHNVANSEQGDTAAASEKDVAAAVESWKRVVETERARWKASERAMESKLKSFKEQTQLLESLVHEKNMEMNKIREIQAAQEDRMQMYDVQKLKGELESVTKERNELRNKLSNENVDTKSAMCQMLANSADLKTNMQSLTGEIHRLGDEVKRLQKELSETTKERDGLLEKLQSGLNASASISQMATINKELTTEIAHLQDIIALKSSEIGRLRGNNDLVNKELDIVREELKKVSIHNENLNKLAIKTSKAAVLEKSVVQDRDGSLQHVEKEFLRTQQDLMFTAEELHQTEKERDALLLDFKNFISDELRVVSDALGEYTPEYGQVSDGKEMLTHIVDRLCKTRSAFLEQVQNVEQQLAEESGKWRQKTDAVLRRILNYHTVIKNASALARELKQNERTLKQRFKDETARSERYKGIAKTLKQQSEESLRKIGELQQKIGELTCDIDLMREREAALAKALQARVKEANQRAADSDEWARTMQARMRETEQKSSELEERAKREKSQSEKRAEEMAQQMRSLHERVKSLTARDKEQTLGDSIKTNEMLRKDFSETRRVLEDKENKLNILQNQYSDALKKLETVKSTYAMREQRLSGAVHVAMKYLETVSGQQSSVREAMSVLLEHLPPSGVSRS